MREELSRWLGRDDLVLEQLTHGASNLTFRLTSGDDDWILRCPPSFVTATSNDMKREWTVIEALAPTEVRVPRVVRTCEDPLVLGRPFYVMERLDGVVFRSVDDVGLLSEAQSRVCTEELVDALATLHAVAPSTVGLEAFGRPEGFVERQVRRWQKQWELTKFGEIPEIDETGRRLAAALPTPQATAIVHGDYSFNNTVFCNEPPTRLQGILDWELSTLGDPLTDVGMLAFYWGEVGEALMSVRQAHRANPGFGSMSDVIERYATSSGLDLGGIDFYVALATLKMAVIAAGSRRRIMETEPERASQLEHKVRWLASVALESAARLGR